MPIELRWIEGSDRDLKAPAPWPSQILISHRVFKFDMEGHLSYWTKAPYISADRRRSDQVGRLETTLFFHRMWSQGVQLIRTGDVVCSQVPSVGLASVVGLRNMKTGFSLRAKDGVVSLYNWDYTLQQAQLHSFCSAQSYSLTYSIKFQQKTMKLRRRWSSYRGLMFIELVGYQTLVPDTFVYK